MATEEPFTLEGPIDALGFYAHRQLADGRWIAVEPQTFGRARLVLVDAAPDLTEALTIHFGYADVWDYDSKAAAVLALEAWDGVGEPTGWTRHYETGRKRTVSGTLCPIVFGQISAELLARLRQDVAAGAGHECVEWLRTVRGVRQCALCDRPLDQIRGPKLSDLQAAILSFNARGIDPVIGTVIDPPGDAQIVVGFGDDGQILAVEFTARGLEQLRELPTPLEQLDAAEAGRLAPAAGATLDTVDTPAPAAAETLATPDASALVDALERDLSTRQDRIG
jgi:hypothetical protein